MAGELRAALERAGAQVQDLGGSGRTDAGVHALAQVAHLRLAERVDPVVFRRAVNDTLPPDVHMTALVPAPAAFHARHDALARAYVYQVSRRRTAFGKRFVWWIKRPLDAGAMAAAAAELPGRHDFALLAERPSEAASTVVVVEHAEVAVFDDLVLFRIVASHFLWKLVRRLMGALVHVAAGELSPTGFAGLLAGRLPAPGVNPAAWTAPPSGLFLEAVLYADSPPLPALQPAVPIRPEPRLRPDLAPERGGRSPRGGRISPRKGRR